MPLNINIPNGILTTAAQHFKTIFKQMLTNLPNYIAVIFGLTTLITLGFVWTFDLYQAAYKREIDITKIRAKRFGKAATTFADEVIATQRCCYRKLKLVLKKKL